MTVTQHIGEQSQILDPVNLTHLKKKKNQAIILLKGWFENMGQERGTTQV